MKESALNGRSANAHPAGANLEWRGKFGRASDDAAPIAVMTFMISERSLLNGDAGQGVRHRATSSACSGVRLSSDSVWRLNTRTDTGT